MLSSNNQREFITSESEKIVKKRKKSDHGSRSEDNNLLHNQNNISEVLVKFSTLETTLSFNSYYT